MHEQREGTWFFWMCYWICMGVLTLVYRARLVHTERVPRTGGVLVVANHQSHLDPPLVGVGVRGRAVVPIARGGLFRVPVLGPVLRWIGCIPIKEEEGDAGAMKAAIAQLKAGRVVVIFPEGSRSPDGAIKEFKRGMWLLVARSGATVVPAAVEGCFDAFPRGAKFPKLFGQRVMVEYGEPIEFARLKEMGAQKALDYLAREIDGMRLGLRAKLRVATNGRVPRPGPGDAPVVLETT